MRWTLPIVLLFAACDAPTLDHDAGADAACALGALSVCIYNDSTSTAPMSGTVTVRRDEADVPWIMRAGEDGCTDELLEPGTWQMSASDSTGTCVTPFEAVEIRPCERTEVRAEVINHCVDG